MSDRIVGGDVEAWENHCKLLANQLADAKADAEKWRRKTGRHAHWQIEAEEKAEALADALERADHYLYRHGWTKQGVEGARGIIGDALARYQGEKP